MKGRAVRRWFRWLLVVGGVAMGAVGLLFASLEAFYRYQLAQLPELPRMGDAPVSLPLVTRVMTAHLGGTALQVQPVLPWSLPVTRRRNAQMPDGGFTLAYAAAGEWLRRFDLPAQPTHWRRQALAVWLTRHASAEQLLAQWSSTVKLPRAAPGLGNASLSYFGRPLETLEVSEVAVLIGSALGPISFDALCRHDLAMKARNRVLHSLQRTGGLGDEEATRLMGEPVGLAPASPDEPCR